MLGCWKARKLEDVKGQKASGFLAFKLASLLAVSLFTFHFSLFTPLLAFDRTNVPLKNWGGFAIQRSWVYDALEKVVLAGLAEQVIFNTKPLNRVEAARIVAQAVERLQQDQYGDYNHRGYLEELLYRLVEEFGPELTEMGVRTPLNPETLAGFFKLHPVDHLQFGSPFSTKKQQVFNHLGERVAKGGNLEPTADGRVQIGDYVSLYYQPQFSLSQDGYRGRLLNGYGKFRLWNTELEVGRDSLWFGPGFRGSMSFSNNALPLNQVRLSSAEPFRLPWLLRYLGPTKLTAFAIQLEDNRDFPKAKIGGWRINIAPSKYTEFGFTRVFQFGGRGRGTLKPWQFLQLFVDQGSDTGGPTQVNNLMSLDATVRWPDARRYIYIARDLSLYGELGWDDTLDPGFRFLFFPTGAIIPHKPGGIVGILLAGVLGDPKLDLRFEYAKTTDIQFTHGIYTSGFTHKGAVLSHFIGTDGDDRYVRLTRWMSPDLLLGFQAGKSHIGATPASLQTTPLSDQLSVGFDVSYRILPTSSLFFGYDFTRARTENRNNAADKGPAKINHLLRFEYTRSFDR